MKVSNIALVTELAATLAAAEDLRTRFREKTYGSEVKEFGLTLRKRCREEDDIRDVCQIGIPTVVAVGVLDGEIARIKNQMRAVGVEFPEDHIKPTNIMEGQLMAIAEVRV